MKCETFTSSIDRHVMSGVRFYEKLLSLPNLYVVLSRGNDSVSVGGARRKKEIRKVVSLRGLQKSRDQFIFGLPVGIF